MSRRSDSFLNKDIGIYVFCISYAIMLSYSLFGHIPTLGGYLKLLENGALTLLALAFIVRLQIYCAQELIVLGTMTFVSVAVIASSGDYGPFKLTMLLASVKGINFSKCVRTDLVLRSIIIPTVMILSVVGIAPDVLSYYDGAVRHSMGFTNPNTFGLACIILCAEILYLGDMRFELKRALVVVGVFIGVYVLSGSRSACLVILLLLVLSIVNTAFPHLFKGHGFLRFAQLVPYVCAAITVFAVGLYNGGSLAAELNELLSGRISNIVYHANLTPVTLFGSDIGANDRTLDSAYAYLLLGQGIIVTCAYALFVPKLFRALSDNGDYACLIILTVLFVYGLSERLWMCVDYDALMLAWSYLVYGKHSGKRSLDGRPSRNPLHKS